MAHWRGCKFFSTDTHHKLVFPSFLGNFAILMLDNVTNTNTPFTFFFFKIFENLKQKTAGIQLIFQNFPKRMEKRAYDGFRLRKIYNLVSVPLTHEAHWRGCTFFSTEAHHKLVFPSFLGNFAILVKILSILFEIDRFSKLGAHMYFFRNFIFLSVK